MCKLRSYILKRIFELNEFLMNFFFDTTVDKIDSSSEINI